MSTVSVFVCGIAPARPVNHTVRVEIYSIEPLEGRHPCFRQFREALCLRGILKKKKKNLKCCNHHDVLASLPVVLPKSRSPTFIFALRLGKMFDMDDDDVICCCGEAVEVRCVCCACCCWSRCCCSSGLHGGEWVL